MEKIFAYKKVFENFLATVPLDIQDEVQFAFDFAEKSHINQYRKSGEPFISHPLAVGIRLWNFYEDKDLLLSGFLHDVVEDCEDVSIETIYSLFGNTVGFIVDSLNKNAVSFFLYPEKIFKDKLERFIWAGGKNIKVYLVKLADRAHNISTLGSLSTQKQINISFETQAIYEPLKRLTLFEKEKNLQKVEYDINLFFRENDLTTDLQKKKFLIEKSFQNIPNELFGLIKKDIQSVLWSLDDYETFIQLSNDKNLAEKLKLVSIVETPNKFLVNFKFTKSFLFSNIKESLQN